MIVSFPWRAVEKVESERTYVALLGFLRLSGPHMLLPFVRFSVRIERQLRAGAGVRGFRTGADFFNLCFYHLSVWTDRSGIQAFTVAAPHVDAMTQLSGRLGQTVFRYWSVAGSELPLRFVSEVHRLSHSEDASGC